MADSSRDKRKKGGDGVSFFKLVVLGAAVALAAAIILTPDNVVIVTCFLLSTYTPWTYKDSQFYQNYVKAKWNKMPYLEPEPIPELTLENFSREEMLRISEGMAIPIVIRGAVKDSVAVQKWNFDYLKTQYGNETVVVREIVNGLIKFQRRSFNDFFLMRDKGRNVSVVASSAIFFRRPEFKTELTSPIEKDLVGPNGEPIVAQQFFITPGGRSWYHAAVGNNVFRQIAGQKRWVVISPDQDLFMCPTPVISGTSVNPCLEELPDHEKDEFIRKVPRRDALLNPGDILINSGWYWHDVQSIGTTHSGPQISVAGRIKNTKATFSNSPLMTINAIVTTILRGKSGEDEEFELALENNIVNSWYKQCMSEKRGDCLSDP